MKISEHNQMIKHITDPRDRKSPEERAKITATQEAEKIKRVATKRKEYGLPDMQKHTINMLNKFEDGPDIKEEDLFVQAIRNSSTPVPGYIGGATPDPTVPTRAERIASQKQLEKYATQPDSRGVYKKAVEQNKKEVAEAEAEYKRSQQYPSEATPEQVARLAYNMEKSRQMTGGDGRYDKPRAIIKKKKIIFSNAKVSPLQLSFDYNPKQTFVAPKDTRTILEIVQDGADQRLRQEQENYDKQFGTSGIAMLKRPK